MNALGSVSARSQQPCTRGSSGSRSSVLQPCRAFRQLPSSISVSQRACGGWKPMFTIHTSNISGFQQHWRGSLLCAGVAGMLLWCQPVEAAALHPQLVLLDSNSGNAAIVGQLKQLQQTKQKFGTQDPGNALAARFTGAQQQLQRIELLVKIQQYDNARMQLRQGSFKSLRSDLRYESEYRGVEPELARGIINNVEKLDRQLRSQQPSDGIAQGIKQLQQQLQELVDAALPAQPPVQ